MLPNLTLEMTVQEACQHEEVKAQVSLQGEYACAVKENARGNRQHKMDERKQRNETEQQHRDNGRSETCNRCGKRMHKKQEYCPAIKSMCNRCKKVGHWERMCKSKVVNEVTEQEENTAYFLGSVKSTPLSSGKQWTVKLNICHKQVTFKIDTGADVCIMSEETFKTQASD